MRYFARREVLVQRSFGRLFVLLAVIAAFSAAPAHASHVQCGDVITQDTTLDGDLLDCPGSGVVIGADGITLDLNGHLIDGIPFRDSDGVVDSAGHDGVTIENGSIQQFRIGVALRQTEHSAVTGVHMREVFSGVQLLFSSHNQVTRNDVSAYVYGIELADDAQENLVERNVLTGSGNGVILKPLGLAPPPRSNRIVKNVITGNQYGIASFGGLSNSIERNSINASSAYGIYLIFTSSGNSVIDNDLFDNHEGIAVLSQTANTTIAGNHIARSDEYGIEVGPLVGGTTLIERNVANGNGEDGIELESARAVVTRNTANDNANFGIDAVPGVTDGGGNKARGNGDPAQCLNVSCK